MYCTMYHSFSELAWHKLIQQNCLRDLEWTLSRPERSKFIRKHEQRVIIDIHSICAYPNDTNYGNIDPLLVIHRLFSLTDGGTFKVIFSKRKMANYLIVLNLISIPMDFPIGFSSTGWVGWAKQNSWYKIWKVRWKTKIRVYAS